MTKVSVILDWVLEPPYAALVWGKDKGYFEEAGIDLEIIPGRGSDLAMSQINEDKLSFAFTDSDVYLVQQSRGETPTKAVYVILDQATTGIASNEPIESLDDMVGTTWGTVGFSSGNVVLPYVLEQNDVDPAGVTIQILDFAVLYASLFDGTIDSAEAHQPGSWESVLVQAQKLGKAVYFTPLSDYGFKQYSKMLIVRNDMIEQDPDLVRRFVGALDRSQQDAVANATTDQVFELIKAFDPQADQEVTGLVWEGYKNVIQKPGPIDPAFLEASISRLQETIGLDGPVDVSTVYTNEFIP